jgi:hypothetical protein
MPRFRTYRCPACAHQWERFEMGDEAPPRFCETCGYDTGGEALPQALAAPRIRSASTKAIDRAYQATEICSENRVEMAERMGLDSDAAAALRITNLNLDSHEGSVAAIPPNNEVSRLMATHPTMMGHGPGAIEYPQHSANVMAGPFPNAGLRAHMQLRHLQATGNNPIVDQPALEIQSPNYVRRL